MLHQTISRQEEAPPGLPTPRLSLLDLPAEIRLMIYRFVMADVEQPPELSLLGACTQTKDEVMHMLATEDAYSLIEIDSDNLDPWYIIQNHMRGELTRADRLERSRQYHGVVDELDDADEAACHHCDRKDCQIPGCAHFADRYEVSAREVSRMTVTIRTRNNTGKTSPVLIYKSGLHSLCCWLSSRMSEVTNLRLDFHNAIATTSHAKTNLRLADPFYPLRGVKNFSCTGLDDGAELEAAVKMPATTMDFAEMLDYAMTLDASSTDREAVGEVWMRVLGSWWFYTPENIIGDPIQDLLEDGTEIPAGLIGYWAGMGAAEAFLDLASNQTNADDYWNAVGKAAKVFTKYLGISYLNAQEARQGLGGEWRIYRIDMFPPTHQLDRNYYSGWDSALVLDPIHGYMLARALVMKLEAAMVNRSPESWRTDEEFRDAIALNIDQALDLAPDDHDVWSYFESLVQVDPHLGVIWSTKSGWGPNEAQHRHYCLFNDYW